MTFNGASRIVQDRGIFFEGARNKCIQDCVLIRV
jgi:hypothetical protein